MYMHDNTCMIKHEDNRSPHSTFDSTLSENNSSPADGAGITVDLVGKMIQGRTSRSIPSTQSQDKGTYLQPLNRQIIQLEFSPT